MYYSEQKLIDIQHTLKVCLELMKRSDARLLHPVIQQKLRHEAIDLFLKEKTQHISKQLGVSRKSVYNWIKAF